MYAYILYVRHIILSSSSLGPPTVPVVVVDLTNFYVCLRRIPAESGFGFQGRYNAPISDGLPGKVCQQKEPSVRQVKAR